MSNPKDGPAVCKFIVNAMLVQPYKPTSVISFESWYRKGLKIRGSDVKNRNMTGRGVSIGDAVIVTPLITLPTRVLPSGIKAGT